MFHVDSASNGHLIEARNIGMQICNAYTEDNPGKKLILKDVVKIKGSDQGATLDCIPYTLQHEIDIISGLDKFLRNPKTFKFNHDAAKCMRQTIVDVLLRKMTSENRQKADKMIADHKRLSAEPKPLKSKKRSRPVSPATNIKKIFRSPKKVKLPTIDEMSSDSDAPLVTKKVGTEPLTSKRRISESSSDAQEGPSPKKKKGPAISTPSKVFCLFSRNGWNVNNLDYVRVIDGDTTEDVGQIGLKYFRDNLPHVDVHIFELATTDNNELFSVKHVDILNAIAQGNDKMLYFVPRLHNRHYFVYAVTNNKGRLQISVVDSVKGRESRHEDEIRSMEKVIRLALLYGFPKIIKVLANTVVVSSPLQSDASSCFYYMLSAMNDIAKHCDDFIIDPHSVAFTGHVGPKVMRHAITSYFDSLMFFDVASGKGQDVIEKLHSYLNENNL